MKLSFAKLAVPLALILLAGANQARADVGIVVYESKGVDSRRTSNGHVALLATRLCAEGIDQVRACKTDEEPGVVITRYANLAFGYDRSVFVAPIRGHFMATTEAREVPVLSSGGTLQAMQIDYWRKHLRTALPPLSQERYQELKDELERFEFGKAFRKLISMELLIGVLGPHKKSFPTQPIAMIDPLTNELIPDGRWREAIGAAHMRTSMTITAPVSEEQEQALIPFIEAVNKRPFQVMADNCSDFVERGLLKVFAGSGLRFRPRAANIADAWITSPLEVATDFVHYAKRDAVPITVTVVPMIAGTRRPTAPITSISRGALVPTPAQGKLAFAMKIYFNTLNPLLGLTSYTVDKLARFTNLPKLVHERGGGELSQLSYKLSQEAPPGSEDQNALRREQVKVFGTTSCWKAKQEEFAGMTAQAREMGLLTAGERALVLKTARPFLLPRLYEQTAAAHKHDGMLTVGMPNSALAPAGLVSNFLPPDSAPATSIDTALVPGRAEVRDMAGSGRPDQQSLAFKLMTSVINYDLSSEVSHRRQAGVFDQDWALFLEIAEKNGLRLPAGPLREPVTECSCREFDSGKEKQDAFGEALGNWHWLTQKSRETVFGANR